MQKETRKYKVVSDTVKEFKDDDFVIYKGIIVDTEEKYKGRFFNIIDLNTGNIQQNLDVPLEALGNMEIMGEIAQKCSAVYKKYNK